jgi:DNA-binding NtrC family response regulator
VDVRVIAATNRDLAEEVGEGRFREDLYYRINVMSIGLPPLRERSDDVPLLVEHFLPEGWDVDPEAQQLLESYPWPGNVRELINAVERATVLADDRLITLDDLPAALVRGDTYAAAPASQNLGVIERAHIVEVLRQERGNKARAARALGIHRRKLYRLLERYEISLDAQ